MRDASTQAVKTLPVVFTNHLNLPAAPLLRVTFPHAQIQPAG